MELTELGQTGVKVSPVALGAMQMGNATSEADSRRILDRFVDMGGNFIDTADCYEWWSFKGSPGGQSEGVIGTWLKSRRRDEIVLATKGGGMPEYGPELWTEDGTANWAAALRTFPNAHGDALRKALDGSLRRLGTDYVDVYYVHVDDRSTPLEETLEALAECVKAGKVRYIGWSNIRTWRLERIRQLCSRNGWPSPVALEQQYTYLRRRGGIDNTSLVDEEQLDFLRENPDVTLVAYSPILKGAYEDPAKRNGHPVMDSYAGPDSDARLAALSEVAAELGVGESALVVAWLMHQVAPRVIPLIGPRTFAQLESLIPGLDLELGEDQLRRLDQAGIGDPAPAFTGLAKGEGEVEEDTSV